MYFRKVVLKILDRFFPEPKTTALVVQQAPLTGTWRRVIPHGSEVTRAYEHKCVCGLEYLYGADEAHVSTVHKCGCGSDFSLLRSLDAIDATGNVNLAALTHGLHNLAIKPVAPPAPAQRFVLVGEENDGETGWSGAPPSSGVQWR